MTEPDILDVQVTENDIVNTTTETDLWIYTVPANTLGTNKALRVLIRCDYLNNSAGTANVRFRIYYGATEIVEDLGATTAIDAARRAYTIDFMLWARNATNSQNVAGTVLVGAAGLATTGIGNLGDDELITNGPFIGINSSEDSTASKVLKVTIAHSVADTNISLRRLYAVIELLAV